jgi:polyhydroxyalkanoate synthase
MNDSDRRKAAEAAEQTTRERDEKTAKDETKQGARARPSGGGGEAARSQEGQERATPAAQAERGETAARSDAREGSAGRAESAQERTGAPWGIGEQGPGEAGGTRTRRKTGRRHQAPAHERSEAGGTQVARRGDGPPARARRDGNGRGNGATDEEARDRQHGLTAGPPELCKPDPFDLPDSYSTQSLNRAFKAHLARFTLGVTPFGLSSTFYAWWIHLMASPGKSVLLAEKAARKASLLAAHTAMSVREPHADPCIEPLPHDNRFDGDDWQQMPYALIYQSFLLHQQWWYNATNDVEGLSRHQEQVVSFVTRQLLDMVSPSNFILTNPEVTKKTLETGGTNLWQGWQHFVEDAERAISGQPPVGAEDYVPGRDVAVTPGRVVFRNHLIELIQYAPKTDKVKAEPILIMPAWIMKYYILDLSPYNSLVKYLVEQGYTVFMISWINPTAKHRDLGMEDYRRDGFGAALDAVNRIVPDRKVHAVGYCIGGTLLTIAAAAMARDGDDRLQSLTFLATQVDFADAGELMLYVSESEVSYLENMMWDQGYLDTKQMAGAFQLLRSNDLIWSRYVHEYLMGKRQGMFDLMAWNADATRMPYRMHSDYLRKLFLANELAQGQYQVDDHPVAVADIGLPIFSVSTTSDHVAPWHSVYKLHLLADTTITFVLTSGGHNAGIISEPGHKGRHYRIKTTPEGARYLSTEAWQQAADAVDGSWWPALVDWLAERSSGETDPPQMGGNTPATRPKEPAPGTYVYQR